MRSVLVGMLFSAACSGAPSSSTATTPRPATESPPPGPSPALLGRPVWDGPLSDPMAVRALERVRSALADGGPVLQGADPRMWLGPLQGWIEKRVKVQQELRADANAMSSDADPRLKLLAAVVYSVAADDFVNDLLAIEPPPEYATGEHVDETKRVFHEMLEKQAAPLAASTRVLLQRCVATAPAAPAPMRVWEAFCRERDGSLAELETRVAARDAAPAKAPEPKPPAMFADCDTQEVRHVDPVAPPPDAKVKPATAYVYAGTQLKGDDVAKLEQAVAAKLGLDAGMPVVDAKELAAARALVAQRRMQPGAPVCGQAPPLAAVIAHKHRNLVIGEIDTTCIWEGTTERCGLMVRYEHAGSDDAGGLPPSRFSKVGSRDAPAADWIAAVEQLAPYEATPGLVGAINTAPEPNVFLAFSGYRDEDPWLRVASTLDADTRERLASCVDAAASFDATFAISPTGKTQKVSLKPVTAPAADSKVAACMKSALEATGWPCPMNGKAAKVSVRVCVAPRPH